MNWFRTLELHAFPRTGKVPVSEVMSAEVLEILAAIWHRKGQTARFVHMRIRAVLEWAVAVDWRTDDPCDRLPPCSAPSTMSSNTGGRRLVVRWRQPSRCCGRRNRRGVRSGLGRD